MAFPRAGRNLILPQPVLRDSDGDVTCGRPYGGVRGTPDVPDVLVWSATVKPPPSSHPSARGIDPHPKRAPGWRSSWDQMAEEMCAKSSPL